MRTEIRYAIRGLLRDRVFALMIVLSLAVGIGANTAIFSLVNGVLLQPPDFPYPERLVALTQWAPKLLKSYPALPVNIGIYTRVAQTADQLRKHRHHPRRRLQSHRYRTARAGPRGRTSAAIFQVLGVQPSLGRTFTEEEEKSGHDQVAILSDALWRRRYQADPAILGRKILLDGKPYEIIGVLPANFNFPRLGKLGQQYAGDGLEIYKPLGYEPDELKLYMGDLNYWTTARLRPGVSPAKAQAELDVVQAAISRQLEGNLDLHASLAPLQERMVGDVRQGLVLLMAAVGAVLLVLCVNLANLGLARAAGRSRDAAIRTALGAGRGRLLGQSLIESLVLSLTGGALGVALAYWGLRALLAAAPIDLPRLQEVHLDARVLLFALAVSLLTGVIFGALPALRTLRSAPVEALKSGGRGNTDGRGGLRVRNVLVTLEVGLSAALLVTAGLLIASFVRLMNIDKGFQVDRVLAMDLSLLSTKYPNPPERVSVLPARPGEGRCYARRAQRLDGVRPAAHGRNLDRYRRPRARHEAPRRTALH